MGQYFLPVNEDKQDWFFVDDVDGESQRFWFWMHNVNQSGTLALLVMNQWRHTRILLVGDYDESELYNEAFERYKHVGKMVKRLKEQKLNDFINSKEKYALINEEDKTFVSGTPEEIRIMLVFLIRQSNDYGAGGDIDDRNMLYISGEFAEKPIFITKESEFDKNGYKNITEYVIKPSMDFYNLE